jgi:hypothetical protein
MLNLTRRSRNWGGLAFLHFAGLAILLHCSLQNHAMLGRSVSVARRWVVVSHWAILVSKARGGQDAAEERIQRETQTQIEER